MKEQFFGQPNGKGKFHIFNKDDSKSLCGRWAMPFFQVTERDMVKGNEKCNDNQDCKK